MFDSFVWYYLKASSIDVFCLKVDDRIEMSTLLPNCTHAPPCRPIDDYLRLKNSFSSIKFDLFSIFPLRKERNHLVMV